MNEQDTMLSGLVSSIPRRQLSGGLTTGFESSSPAGKVLGHVVSLRPLE